MIASVRHEAFIYWRSEIKDPVVLTTRLIMNIAEEIENIEIESAVDSCESGFPVIIIPVYIYTHS